MAKLTLTGYQAKMQNEYFKEQSDLLQTIDPDWNLDPSTPDGLKIAKDAEIFANLDECIQQIMLAKDPATASGMHLAIICALTGFVISPGTYSTVTLQASGVAGTRIPAGSVVDSGRDTVKWITTAEATIAANGRVSILAQCESIGAIYAAPNSITRIVEVIGGWQSVTNPAAAVAGRDRETDAQIRRRRALTVAKAGSNSLDSILAAIYALPNVLDAVIYANSTATTDARGLPARSMAVVVHGGDDAAIAKAIFKRPVGAALATVATAVTVTNVYDQYPQNAATIVFNRPIYVDMKVDVDLVNDGTLPANYEDQIRKSIVAYANGTSLPDGIGFNTKGYGIGKSVPVSQIATPINKVIGAYGASYVKALKVNNVGATATVPLIAIAFNQMARFTEANITVKLVNP